MAPPESIQNSNASYGVCLPDGSVQGVEILVSTDASQQSCGADAIVVGVQNYSEGLSYVRPVEVTRQPTNVFQTIPLQGSHKRAAIALGDALQTLINDHLARGEEVDPRLEDIAQTLHEGKLPDLDDPDIADLFNRSYNDTALDAVIHSIGLQADASPNRSLHAQALQYSLPYYLQQNTGNPADNTIRKGLVTALSNSGPEGRQVLAEAGRNASPAIQQQIQTALSSNPLVTTNNSATVSSNTINSGGSAPETSALRLASTTQLGAVSTLPASTLSASFAAPSTLSSLMVASANLGTPEVITNVLLGNNLSPLLSGAPLNLSLGTSPGLSSSGFSPLASGNPFNVTEGLTSPAANVATSNNTPNTNVQAANPGSTDISAPANNNQVLIAVRQELQSLGFSDSTIQSILNNAPSPLLMGYVALQAGVHQSMSQQAISTTPVFNPRTVENGAYRVAAVNRAETGSDQEGFGSSREDSSGGGQGERQGSSGQGHQGQENPQEQNPADIYTSNLA